MALQIGFTYWAVRGDSVAVVGEEERREGEVVLRRAMLEDLAAEVCCAGTFGEDGCHVETSKVLLLLALENGLLGVDVGFEEALK